MALYQDGNIEESFNVYVDWEHSQFHNLVRNSAFNFFRITGELIDWQRTNLNTGGSLVTVSPYNGLANYRITGTGGAVEGQLMQNVSRMVKRGVSYYLSAYIDLSSYTSGDVIIKLRSETETTDYATITLSALTIGWERQSLQFTSPDPVPDDLAIYIESNSFTGTVDIDALCLEEASDLGLLPYTPFETYRPIAGTTDYQNGVTEIESDTTGYVDVTSWVTQQGLEAILESPESGSIVVNRGTLELFNGNLGLSPKIFTAYDPANGYFNGPDHGDSKGNVRSGRRVIISVTADDGTTAETSTIFTGTLETPNDLGLQRTMKFSMWGRAYTLEKNKINFVRLNRANNLVRNSGFEYWDTDETSLETTNPTNWVNSFGAESVTIKAIKNVNFGVVAPELTGTGVGDNTISLYQDLQDFNGANLTLNGTYQVRLRIKANNGTVNPAIAALRCVATAGSFVSGSSVSATTAATSGYVEVELEFTTVGDAEVRVYCDAYTSTGNAYSFSFDNCHVVQSYESVDYDTGISFVAKDLLKKVGFGTADLNVTDDFKIVEFFQVNNEEPLKKLAQLLQVGRMCFLENEYGQIVINHYDSYIADNLNVRTIDLSHFKDSGFKVETMPAYNSVVIESDPVVAHDTFGKRIESGAVIGDQLSKTPTQRIKFEDIDEVFINQFSVGRLTADQIEVGIITAEKVDTSPLGSTARIDINVTIPNRLSFLDSASNNLLTIGTANKTGLYGSGNFLICADPQSVGVSGQQGIFSRIPTGQGCALVVETGNSIADSNALIVRDDTTFSGVAIRAIPTSVSGLTKTAGGGIQLNSKAIEFRAPTGDAYGSGEIIFKAYTTGSAGGNYSNFLFKSPNDVSGVTINTVGGNTGYIGFNSVYSGSWNVITGTSGGIIGVDAGGNMSFTKLTGGTLATFATFSFGLSYLYTPLRIQGTTISTGEITASSGINAYGSTSIGSAVNVLTSARGIDVAAYSTGIKVGSTILDGIEVTNAGRYGIKTLASSYGGAFEGAGGGVYGLGTGSSTGGTFISSGGWGLYASGPVRSATFEGDVYVGTTLVHTSDMRMKTDVRPISSSLDKIIQLEGVNFKWREKFDIEYPIGYTENTHNKSSGRDTVTDQTGFIAQEVEKIFPELVALKKAEFRNINYIGLIPHLVEAIKELKSEIDLLKVKV